MTIAYFDTTSGIAGDMTLAALVDAGADANYVQQQILSLGLPQVHLRFTETTRHCFRALRLDVEHPPEQAHRHLSDIEAMLAASRLAVRERDIASRLFRRIAAAEAKVHGTTLEAVHFHEVGAIDSIVDIVGTAVALCNLDIRHIIASPTPVGAGTIHIAHGAVSVPAPATAELLRGIPIRSSAIQAELTTPTGAAILAVLADGFGVVPDMQIQRIGYGAGHKDLAEQANLLRILIGKRLEDTHDEVLLLETNLDDVTGEQLGFAIERLWGLGALDVFTCAVSMKKNRPGTLLSVLCQPEQRIAMEDCLFEHSGTLGIRRTRMERRKLARKIVQVTTPLGEARAKLAWLPAGGNPSSQVRIAPEYEDCRRLALESGQSLETVFLMVREAAQDIAEKLSPPSVVAASATAAEGHEHGERGHLPQHDHDHDHHDHHHDHHDHHHDHHHGH